MNTIMSPCRSAELMGRTILHASTIGWHGAMQCAHGYENLLAVRSRDVKSELRESFGPRTDCKD